MSIGEIVKQGFYYARTCRSLWLFGFFVGIASGGSNSAGGGGGNGSGGVGFLALSVRQVGLIAVVALFAVAVGIVMRFVAEGALIEGIVRARRGGRMTTREGFRAGWANWGVLVRIALLYLAATVGSVVILAAPCVIALRLHGPFAGLLFGLPALLIAVPWLVTLYVLQAFAWRIAVLENRRAFDAIAKARLFLHGRIMHGLKLIVATFAGTLGIVLAAIVVLAPAALLLVALIPVIGVVPVIVLACGLLVPSICVLTAILGTFRSSIWTIGYMTQVES